METKKNIDKAMLIIGLLGAIAGICLLFLGSYIIGTFGFISSTFLVFKSFKKQKPIK